jgi:hypothetical protein
MQGRRKKGDREDGRKVNREDGRKVKLCEFQNEQIVIPQVGLNRNFLLMEPKKDVAGESIGPHGPKPPHWAVVVQYNIMKA